MYKTSEVPRCSFHRAVKKRTQINNCTNGTSTKSNFSDVTREMHSMFRTSELRCFVNNKPSKIDGELTYTHIQVERFTELSVYQGGGQVGRRSGSKHLPSWFTLNLSGIPWVQHFCEVFVRMLTFPALVCTLCVFSSSGNPGCQS